jgi:hypothetical protein
MSPPSAGTGAVRLGPAARPRPWHEAYVGKPWKASPNPPLSYNCGELCRSVYLDRLGLETAVIKADARKLDEVVRAFDPATFGVRPLAEGEARREFDIVFMRRARYADHCGVAVDTADGLLILHCLQARGVALDSPMEALGRGFARLDWHRYVELDD